MIDPSGGWSISAALGISKIGAVGVSMFVGAIAGGAATAGSGNAKGMIVGAFLGLASNLIGSGGGAIGLVAVQAVVGGGKILANNAVAMPSVAPQSQSIAVPALDIDNTNNILNSSPPDPFEEKIRKMINNGLIKEALLEIITNYSVDFSLPDKNYDIFVYLTPSTAVFSTMPPIRLPSGKWGCAITANGEEIKKFGSKKKSFGYIVRGLFHEFFHVMQFLKINSFVSEGDDTDQFTAIYLSFQSTTIPSYSLEEEKGYINYALYFYSVMPKEKQDKYKTWKEKLEKRLTIVEKLIKPIKIKVK